MAIGDFRITSIVRAYALVDNAGTAERVRLSLANAAEFEPVIADITYEGDGTETTVFRATGFNVTLTFDALPVGLLEAFNKTAVTTGLPTGATDRVYWMTTGDATGVVCGLEVVASVIDDTANVTKFLSVVAPVGTLSTLTPPALANNDKAQTELQFSAKLTAIDIAGDPLPSVPAGGCYWYYDVYANTATFA
jgi:hypothetical protein